MAKKMGSTLAKIYVVLSGAILVVVGVVRFFAMKCSTYVSPCP
jgi:uncharacterized membrane protein HdeD (DUF308 family)